MTTPNDSFEEELRALQPAAPSLRLASRIAADLTAPTAAAAIVAHPVFNDSTPRRHMLSLCLAWGVAAAMTLAFFTRTPAPTPAAVVAPAPETATVEASPRFTPVSATNTLVGALDEGLVTLEDGRTARKVRYEFLDTVDLLSADAPGATIAVTFPREEIRLVPVQTY